MSWQQSVNQAVGVSRLGDIKDFVRHGPSIGSPIDTFYSASREILMVGTPAFLRAHPPMGPLLLVGLVSATENYFRDIFARIIQVCPVAKEYSAKQTINFGSVIWHGSRDMERGAFEHISFANSDTIIKSANNFLGFQIKATGALDEFAKVCELRHGIVHAGAVVSGKNAVRLHIASSGRTLHINIDFAQLQECGDVCNTLVASVNTELFVELARRWAQSWPKLASWDPTRKHQLFKRIWQAFYSSIDNANHSIPDNLSMLKCKNRVAATFT